MSLLLLIILLGIALGGTIWGVMWKDRYYQFPTLFCTTWLLYFGPQMIGAVINKTRYPENLHKDCGLEMALFFCILCTLMGLAGYAYGRTARKRLFRFKICSCDRLFLGGIVVYAVGLWGAYKLAQLSGGFIAEFTQGAHYALEWRGAPVRYSFFAQLVYPSFLLILLPTLRHPTVRRWIIVGLCLIYPLAVTLFLGRRSMTAVLVVTALVSAFFARRWAPPRAVFATLLVLAGIGVILGPAYRTKSQYGLSAQELRTIDARGILADTLGGESIGEFDVIIYGCAAANRGLAFDYGVNIYNGVIGALLPRQLVGEQLKNGLFVLPTKNVWALTQHYYGWSLPYGSNPTGPFSAFSAFWFFGCLFYFFLGVVYRCLWTAASSEGNVGAQVWYTATAIVIPTSVFGTVSGLLALFLPTLILFGVVLYFARLPGTARGISERRVMRVCRNTL